MTNHHHGMLEKRGTKAMAHPTSNGSTKPGNGRFGRMFPELAPLYTNPNDLKKLGELDGPMDGGDKHKLTECVPLGFIFLGQFVDHDITLDVQSILSNVNNPNEIENSRTPSLDLDCVYGGGPEASRHLYDNRKERGEDKGVYLLTGADFYDNGDPRHFDLMRNPAGDALIGDFRNDENRIVSQLQLAFVKFHNHVAKRVKDNPELAGKEYAGKTLKGGNLFEAAQKTVRWHYQWIVVNQFLHHMIGKEVVQDILGCGRKYYKPQHGAFIPIEFSAAAYRFGHSMITNHLRVKSTKKSTVKLFSKELGLGFTPITDIKQVVDWKAFFEVNGSHPQLANQLDTQLAEDLLDLPFIDAPDEKSLATRNLLRGQSFLLPAGEKVAEAMYVPSADIKKVIDHIHKIVKGYKKPIDLNAGIPLWFYILAEAEVIGCNGIPGEGLGPVGGRIVGEVLIGLLECDESSFLGSNRSWAPTLGTDGRFTMADLLTF